MFLLVIFIISGLAIVVMIAGKIWEEKTRRHFFLLRLISRGDQDFHELSQKGAHAYADLKEEVSFILTRQVPLHTKNLSKKGWTLAKDRGKFLASDIRRRLLGEKREGITEFLRDISETENGENGDDSQDNEGELK